ncbi:hypothetical protein JD844_023747 [Phrynosoma platyrhinos]|uniref:RecF/RecN/SMC N-terminal domain-containing protein n=1 Tax=Phrynosoma platyrhinos TaxID=52577 RepID=A0ABQ7SX28_PHRPL|nr:hypothetical protein JD844_023747 [Phrynosoma platyrhinos]
MRCGRRAGKGNGGKRALRRWEAVMAKRKEGSFSTPASSKRPRQEFTEDSDDDPSEELSQLQSDNGINSQTVPGEVGIIESIKLKNFMCHSMLGPFEFGSNVNFLVGNNGSGKSAVLTALIVGLGGKATMTNRGSSLKCFVKDGQSSADITITLQNRGEDAFKPEQYGSSITVNQHISSEGHRSAVISTKKEDLTAILDHFNIQVDNPVSVLTQEMSKQFLQSKSEVDKYKFFIKATQLEQMKEGYSYIVAAKTRTSDQVEQGAEVRDTENDVKIIRADIDGQEARTEKFVEKVKEWKRPICFPKETAQTWVHGVFENSSNLFDADIGSRQFGTKTFDTTDPQPSTPLIGIVSESEDEMLSQEPPSLTPQVPIQPILSMSEAPVDPRPEHTQRSSLGIHADEVERDQRQDQTDPFMQCFPELVYKAQAKCYYLSVQPEQLSQLDPPLALRGISSPRSSLPPPPVPQRHASLLDGKLLPKPPAAFHTGSSASSSSSVRSRSLTPEFGPERSPSPVPQLANLSSSSPTDDIKSFADQVMRMAHALELNVTRDNEEAIDQLEKWVHGRDRVTVAEEKQKTIQDKLEKITEEAQHLQPLCTALKTDVQAAHNRSQAELKRLVKDHEQLCQKIEELKNSAEQISDPERLEKQKRIDNLKEQLKTLYGQDESIAHQIKQFQYAINTYREDFERLRKEEHELKRSMDFQMQQLKELKESKTNRLKRFGQYMPALCEAIERAYQQRQFTCKPVGPLGAFIHLKDADLALAVESCLKGLVLAFCCDNHKDERELQTLMSKFCQPGSRPQIIVSRFQTNVYDTRARAVVHPNFPSVLTALDFDNAVVANCLIDMRGIETVLLIKNNSEARRVMQQNRPPKNCREAFTGEGDQVFERRYYSSEFTRPRFLSRDVEGDIRHLEEEVKNKQISISRLQQQIHHVEKEMKENNRLLTKHYQHQKDIQINIRKINSEIKDLENVEEHQSVVISTLEEEKKSNRLKMEAVKETTHEQKKKMEELKCVQQEAEQKLVAIKEKILQMQEEAIPFKERSNEAECELQQCKNNLRHYEDKEKAHVESINKRKNDLAAKEKELAELIAKASKIHPERIEVNRTYKSLVTEMNRLKEKINSERQRTGDRDEIIRQLQEAKEKYQSAESKVKGLKKFIRLVDEVMAERFKVYEIFRRYLALRCKYCFNSLLSQRSFSGKMEFDHKNEKLSITVQPGEANKAALDDMKSLSGGERSFSTVCFILSLWSIAESPFRCLDEFDVYMDMVNRRISMDMLLKMAYSQRYRQFILITPQNMSSLPSSRLVRILRMSDPERGQSTLKFHHRGDEDEDEE